MFNKDFIVSNKLILKLGTCTYQFRTDFIRLYSKFQNRRSNDNGRPSHLHVLTQYILGACPSPSVK